MENLWPTMLQTIDNKIKHEMDSHYNNLNRKLDTLQNKQGRTDNKLKSQQFNAGTVNLTKITFSKKETNVLNNSLKNSIEKPLDKQWVNLIMETEQAIRMLDTQAPLRMLATKKLK